MLANLIFVAPAAYSRAINNMNAPVRAESVTTDFETASLNPQAERCHLCSVEVLVGLSNY
jgi:hypothetical protein